MSMHRIRLKTGEHNSEMIIEDIEILKAHAPEAFAENRLNSLFASHLHYLSMRRPSPVESPAPLDLEAMRKIGEAIRTQDNRCTDQPLFLVQQKIRRYGMDPAYCDEVVWIDNMNDSVEVTDPEEVKRLDKYYDDHADDPEGFTRTGYLDQWEFVTACFTVGGCEDYLARNGHNLKEPRIYADGSYRNEEFRAVRNFLTALQPSPQDTEGGAA